MSLRVILLTVTLCLSTTLGAAEDPLFPFLAEIKKDKVNIRSGQSVNFARILQMEMTEEVIVLGEQFGWYKIQLPERATIYISAKYVHLTDASTGVVTGDRVNLRPLPSVNHAAIGQVGAGETLEVIELKDEWVKIKAPKDIYGWVRQDMVSFKSKEVPKNLTIRSRPEKTKPVEQSSKAVIKPVVEKESPKTAEVKKPAQPPVKVEGYLDTYSGGGDAEIAYQLTLDGQPVYLIKGMKSLLDKYLGQKVELTGSVETGLQTGMSYPVIKARSLSLIL